MIWQINSEPQFQFAYAPSKHIIHHRYLQWKHQFDYYQMLLLFFFLSFRIEIIYYVFYTNGNAAQYFINVFKNHLRSIWIIDVSIMVTTCIIQISLAERATSEAAIKINRPVSLLHAFGIMIPVIKWKQTKNNIYLIIIRNKIKMKAFVCGLMFNFIKRLSVERIFSVEEKPN